MPHVWKYATYREYSTFLAVLTGLVAFSNSVFMRAPKDDRAPCLNRRGWKYFLNIIKGIITYVDANLIRK